MEVEVMARKPVWVAWTNTDLTEGKGYNIPYCVAESLEAATRLSRGHGVHGTDCHVTEEVAVTLSGYTHWFIPGTILYESSEDKKLRLKRIQREQVIARVRAAGLSDEDIAILTKL